MKFFFSLLALLPILATAQEERALDLRIPVVDMQDYYSPDRREAFLDTLYNAMHEVGFFAVRNTSVDRSVIRDAYFEAEKFFKQPQEIKQETFVKALNGQRGFVPGETAKGNQAKDCKEFYHIGRELSLEETEALGLMQNLWPKEGEFREKMVTLYNELDGYVSFLFEAIVEVINRNAEAHIPLDFLTRLSEGGDSLLRALYYPALSQEKIGNFCWAAAHTDIDLLAILPYATEKGLQVERDGEWFNVIVPEDAFIVNVGDMLENLTNGLFTSARHRVMALEAGKERFSMVLFVHPPSHASLAPLVSCVEQTGGVQKYAPGTRLEFLWERLLELNIAPALLAPYSQTGHTERQALFGRESPQVVDMLIEQGLASEELLEILSSR